MHSVPRKLTLGLILAAGVAACGDDVTVTPPPDPTPAVRAVVVSPSSATIAQGGSFEFGAAVDADAGIPSTVTWTVSGGSGFSITGSNTSASVIVGASATATGSASVCATSTANTAVRGCAQLAVTPAAPASSVQIDAITEGCAQINVANPAFIFPCGFNTPVSINNVFGQIDVRGTVERHGSSDVRAVRVEVFATDANGAIVSVPAAICLYAGANPCPEYRNSETLLAQEGTDPSIAAQTATPGSITHSIQTADYILLPNATSPTGARVVHPNGQKKIRLTLLGVNDTPLSTSSTSERTLTFRNANGFHVLTTTNLNSGNNANSTCGSSGTAACPIRVNALAGPTAGLAYNGGTPLQVTAIPVIYATGVLHPNGFNGTIVQGPGTGIGFGSAACDLSGVGPRFLGGTPVTALANTNGSTAGTLPYDPAPLPGVPLGASVTRYEMAPVCVAAPAASGGSATGEVPFGVGVDLNGNPVINIALAGVYGARNTLNTPFGPINGTYPTAPAIRLDNRGPAAIAGYATGRNDVGVTGSVFDPDACFGLWLNAPQTTGTGFGCGAPPAILTILGVPVNATPQAAFVFGRTARMNGWTNPPVEFNKISATQVTAAGLAAVLAASQSSEGAVAPSGNATGLPLDAGIGAGVVGGNPSTLIARVGTFGTGGTCITVATCAALPSGSIRATAAGLTETNTGFSLGAIIQSVDPFGNLTNPPAAGTVANPGGTVNFGVTACPANVLVVVSVALCLPNPLDPINPYVVGGVLTIGFDATTPTILSRGGPAQPLLIGAVSGTSTRATSFDNTTIQGTSAADFDYQADDAVPVGLLGTSGILSLAPGSDLYVSLSRRDGATIQYFCPNSVNYQPLGNTCPTQFGWAANAASGVTTATIYNRGTGRIFTDPSLSLVRAYYAIVVFTRDQAGNQTTLTGTNGITAQSRSFIFDNTPPSSFGAAFSPGILPAAGPVVFTGNATEDLDVGRGAISIGFASLVPLINSTPVAQLPTPVATGVIRLAWTNKTTGLANPVGYLADGPSTLSIQLSSTWSRSMRSIEVVNPGDNVAPPAVCGVIIVPSNGNGGFTCGGNATGAFFAPGGLAGGGIAIAHVQDGNLATGAGPTQFNWFTQSVSRVGLLPNLAGPQGTIPAGTATALNYGQSGLLGTADPCGGAPGTPGAMAWWTSVQAAGVLCNGVANQFFNMQWGVLNTTQPNATTGVDLDLTGNANGNNTNTKTVTAVAFGANGPMQQPFLGGVKFYAIDIRQPMNVDANIAAAPTGVGVALIEICSATSIFNDQATNTWQFSCSYTPSLLTQTYDFEGFNFPNSANMMASWAPTAGPVTFPPGFVAGNNTPTAAGVTNAGLWGGAVAFPFGQTGGPPGFNQGWQGLQTTPPHANNLISPVLAIGCTQNGNCLATRVNTSITFTMDN